MTKYKLSELAPGQPRLAYTYYYEVKVQAQSALAQLNGGGNASWPEMLRGITNSGAPVLKPLWGISIDDAPTFNEWGEAGL